MPAEHDEDRERQLAALRRYVSDLDVRRPDGGVDPPPPARERRPGRPWLAVTVALMAASLATGVALGNRDDGEPAAARFAGVTTGTVPAPSASPECAEAVERANRSISHAVRMSAALREHTEIMNDLLQGRVDGDEALKTGTPSLIVGAAEAAKFDVALADYRRVVDRCQLRAG